LKYITDIIKLTRLLRN